MHHACGGFVFGTTRLGCSKPESHLFTFEDSSPLTRTQMLFTTRRFIAFTSIASACFFATAASAAPCLNGANISGTCEIPTGMNRMQVELWGAGGGGGGSDILTSDPAGGGGGGAYCGAVLIATPGRPVEIVSGSPGVEGLLNQDGSSGGASSLTYDGRILSAEGGQGGSSSVSAAVQGGSGGVCNSAAFPAATAFRGGRGAGAGTATGGSGGGGGGSGTATADGADASASVGGLPSGAGGTAGNGGDGGDPGGGGAGAGMAGISGGSGGPGLVRLTFSFVAPPVVAAAAPTAVPTLDQWALMMLSVLIAAAAILNRRKRN